MGLPRIAGRIGQWRWLVFGLCVAVLGVTDLRQAGEAAAAKFSDVTTADWAVTNIWLKSADCARQTGAWLAICTNGKLTPLANHALADDPGHALLLGLWAQLVERPMAVVDVATLNIALDFAGMVSLAALLFAARSYVASIILLLLGGSVYLNWIGISPHPGLIGAASMAAILPGAILLGGYGHLSKSAELSFLAVGALLLGVAAMVREPFGTMGLIVGLGAVIVLGFRAPGARSWLRLLPLVLVVLISWQTPRWVLLARDAVFSVPPTSQIETHGTSHNIYLGLGAVENKFGINWSDADGMTAATKVDPNVVYVSREYFRILWKAYLDRIVEDPLEVARIYASKTAIILSYHLPDWSWSLWLVLLAIGALLIVGHKLRLWERVNYEQGPPLLYVGLAFVGFFVLQGVLAHHNAPYAHPVGAFVLLFLAVSLELLARGGFCLLAAVRGDDGR